jgi:ABC-2 type transport system ATP-binding protein
MITVEQLSKHFSINQSKGSLLQTFFSRAQKLVKAVDNISFDIPAGEVVGYLGPNGAGKSTTIKMLAGLLVPSSGSVLVNGLVPWQQRQRYVAQIGVVFGQRSTLWWDLPVIESLELLQFIYHIPAVIFRERLAHFETLLGLGEFLQTPARALSLGQRMRADLAAALLHNPPLLFLDEPTIGLDVVAKERIRGFITHINQQFGTTVLLTTHDLADVQRLCSRVMMIDRGGLLYDGLLEQLLARFGGQRRLVVDFAQPYHQPALPNASILAQDGLRVSYGFEQSLNAAELIRSLTERYQVQDISLQEPDIEATVRNIYEQKLLGGA